MWLIEWRGWVEYGDQPSGHNDLRRGGLNCQDNRGGPLGWRVKGIFGVLGERLPEGALCRSAALRTEARRLRVRW